MELKQGYKQTEVGVIPEDWELVTFNEISEKIIGGGTPSRTNKNYWGNEIPWVTVKDFATFNPLFAQESITKVGLKNSASHLIPRGTLITSTRMALGKAVIYKVDVAINQDLKAIFPKNTLVANFLFYWFQKNSKKIEELGSGSTVMGLSLVDLKKIPFTLPTIHEQTAIANALSDMDALISQTEKLIEKKKAIKQGAMQELLKPKEGWDKVTIGNVINVARGGSPRPIQEFLTSDANGINWIKIGDTDIESKYIDSANEKIIPEGEKNSRKVNVGDFLLSNSMSFGRPYILNIDGCIHDGWLVLQNYNAHFDREFLYYSLMSSYVLKQYLRLAAGSGVLNLNKEIVKGVTILKPRDLKEQRSIADILSTMDKDIDLQITKLNKLKQQKQGMMQALLTGKIRLVS
jgi:type I restriction enzyme S subunit